MKRITLFLAITVFSVASCSQGDSDRKSAETYEKGKMTVEEIEKKNPLRFLSVSGEEKKNLIRQTVTRGTIVNNAKMVSYKDIELKLSFYSKTGALLEEDRETIYETVAPGASLSFKTKLYTAKGTDSVGIKIVSAKF